MISQSIYDLEAITIIICGLRKTPPVWCQMVNAIQQNPPTKLYCWSSSSCIKKTVPLIIIIMDQQNSTLDLHHHGSKLECPTISFDFNLLTKVLTFQRRIETKFQSLVLRRDGSGDEWMSGTVSFLTNLCRSRASTFHWGSSRQKAGSKAMFLTNRFQ